MASINAPARCIKRLKIFGAYLLEEDTVVTVVLMPENLAVTGRGIKNVLIVEMH